jgi:hypothetical protein
MSWAIPPPHLTWVAGHVVARVAKPPAELVFVWRMTIPRILSVPSQAVSTVARATSKVKGFMDWSMAGMVVRLVKMYLAYFL